MRKLLSWLVPIRLSIDVNLRAKKGGKKKTGETLPLFFLAPSLGPLRFVTSHSRFALAYARDKSVENEAPPQLS